MILQNIINKNLDLNRSEGFKKHAETKGSYTDFLVQQLNTHNLKNFFKDKQDLNILDLGGNIGLWSLYLAPICKNITIVEPTPSHCEVAIELFKIFNEERNIQLIQGAVSDINGQKDFCIGHLNSTMNSFYQHRDHSQIIAVPTFKLKDLIKFLDYEIDLIKMDIEGSEQQVILDNDFDSFIYNNVKSIYLEIHESLGANYSDIFKKLISLNYNIEKIGSDTLYAFK